jgi:uncharacterized protein
MNDADFAALRAKVTAITRPEPSLLWYYVIAAFLSTLCILPVLPIVLVPLYFRYHTLRYRIDDEGVFMSVGILFRREMQLTYARMQDIHLSQGILERWFGIGTVMVQTAGAGEGGNLRIVGVKDYEAIRDYLYARMRGVREHKAPAAAQSTATLEAIRDALNRAAEALERKAAK